MSLIRAAPRAYCIDRGNAASAFNTPLVRFNSTPAISVLVHGGPTFPPAPGGLEESLPKHWGIAPGELEELHSPKAAG